MDRKDRPSHLSIEKEEKEKRHSSTQGDGKNLFFNSRRRKEWHEWELTFMPS
jgi:hypothetical protein